jgi:hypothetical protein
LAPLGLEVLGLEVLDLEVVGLEVLRLSDRFTRRAPKMIASAAARGSIWASPGLFEPFQWLRREQRPCLLQKCNSPSEWLAQARARKPRCGGAYFGGQAAARRFDRRRALRRAQALLHRRLDQGVADAGAAAVIAGAAR